MPCKMITAPTFPLLEARLLADIRHACKRGPLTPKWLVVPSATLANHLRVRLAAGAGDSAFGGVRVAGILRFVQQFESYFGLPVMQRWNPTLDLMLFELAQGWKDGSALGSLKTISGGAALLRETFLDLAEGGFGPAQKDILEELAEDPELTPTERETLRAYIEWLELLRKRAITWEPLFGQQLGEQIEGATDEELQRALSCEDGQSAQLFLYGFYEWTDVNLAWLTALAGKVFTNIYYPHTKKHAAFSFADSVLDHLRGRFSGLEEEQVTDVPAGTAEFFLSSFPEGAAPLQPPFITWQRASGVRAEVISAAVRIRKWLDEEKLLPEDILVVAPQAENYVGTVQDVFEAFAIPLRVADVSAGPTPDSEPIKMLARIWQGQAPAEWVLSLLRACPGMPCATGLNVDRFEWKVRELGIWGGAAWRAALTRAEFKADEDEEKPGCVVRFDEAEKKFIEHALQFVSADGAALPSAISVENALRTLEQMRDQWLPDPSVLQPLIEATETVRRVNGNLEIDLRQWTQWLAEAGGTPTQRDPLTRAVLLVPLMRSRGLTTKAVVVLGLAAGQLPSRVQDDPFLSERTSAKLASRAQELGHWLPVKARVTEEMLLLFFLVNTVVDRVHWVVPETDAQGKAVSPTPWAQRYLQKWEKKSKDKETADPLTLRIARAPFEQAVYLAKLDSNNGTMLPPSMALFVAPHLAALCDAYGAQAHLTASLDKHGREPAWSGCIQMRPSFPNDRISVTSLEDLVRCPYRFYASRVVGWEPLEPLSLSHDLDVLIRGILLHKLLELTVKPHLRAKPLGNIATELLVNDAAALRESARRLPEDNPDAAFALAMLPTVFQQHALRNVVEMAAKYFESVRESTAVPQEAEEKYSREFTGLADLQVVGKIDRVDQEDARTVLLDFKSGKKPRNYSPRLVGLGYFVQVVLYPWLHSTPEADFRYVYLGRDVPEEAGAKGAPESERFLQQLAPIVQTGLFIPTSNQVLEEMGIENISPCEYCKFVSACRRFEPGAASRHKELFERLCTDRHGAILAAVK